VYLQAALLNKEFTMHHALSQTETSSVVV